MALEGAFCVLSAALAHSYRGRLRPGVVSWLVSATSLRDPIKTPHRTFIKKAAGMRGEINEFSIVDGIVDQYNDDMLV